MNVRIMPPRLEHSVLYQVITSPHVGHITLLILLHALLPATTFGDVLEKLQDNRTEMTSTSQHQKKE